MSSNDDRDLEQMTTVFTQLLARVAENVPEVVEQAVQSLPAEQQAEARHAISLGRWNNRRG